MRISGSLICAIAAFGFASVSIGPALSATHDRSAQQALATMTLSLNEAASAAQKTTGGMPVHVVFKDQGGSGIPQEGIRSEPTGKLTYTVITIKDGALTQSNVDGLTGQVSPGKPLSKADITPDNQGVIIAAQQPPKVSLQQATAAAEEKARGRAIQSSLTTRDGKAACEIDVVAEAGGVTEVVVDPASGTVTVK